jgi:hypothetical protein
MPQPLAFAKSASVTADHSLKVAIRFSQVMNRGSKSHNSPKSAKPIVRIQPKGTKLFLARRIDDLISRRENVAQMPLQKDMLRCGAVF